MNELDIGIFLKVRDQYCISKSEISLQKKFHFYSRCYLWFRKPEYLEELHIARAEWLAPFARVCERLKRASTISYAQKVPRKKYRRDAMKKYYHVREYNRFFFRCLFERILFKSNCFEDSVVSIDIAHMANLRNMLMADTQSVFMLSTHAVNFLVLSNYFFGDNICPLPERYFLDVGDSVVLSESHDDLDARVYLYTHAIIGASRFYSESISGNTLSLCREMLMRVEQSIESHYEMASLDHKCEFLVCAILCGYSTPLRLRIYKELCVSISDEPLFFRNMQNDFSEKKKHVTLSSMEHTNVLALMSFIPRNEF